MKIKDKTHKIISVDTEKSPHKVQHPVIIKILNKLALEGYFLSLMKKPTGNIILNGKELK